jgi:hypothetical protein
MVGGRLDVVPALHGKHSPPTEGSAMTPRQKLEAMPITPRMQDLLRLAASPDARVGHSDIWPAKLLARRSVTMFYVHQ